MNRRARNNVSSNWRPKQAAKKYYASAVPSSLILVTLMMEAIRSSEISVFTRLTQRNIPEDGVLHSHRRENLKFYIELTGWAL
jgi:hypothetical protein